VNLPRNFFHTCRVLKELAEGTSVAPSGFSNIFRDTDLFWWQRSVLKKLHSIHFSLNNTNFVKKGGAILVTNTTEIMFNKKFYLTKTLSGAFVKFRSEKKTFLVESRCKWNNVILV